MDELDSLVFGEIKKLATDPEYFKILRDKKKADANEPNKIDILKKEIENLDDQISRFMDLYGIGKFTIEQVSNKIDPLNDQRQALEKELSILTTSTEALSEEETIEIATSFGDILERGELDEIRLAIESLIYYVEIDEDDIFIHWKFS